jgi:hypothetical protein
MQVSLTTAKCGYLRGVPEMDFKAVAQPDRCVSGTRISLSATKAIALGLFAPALSCRLIEA